MFYLLFVTNKEIAEIMLDFYVMEKYLCIFCEIIIENAIRTD